MRKRLCMKSCIRYFCVNGTIVAAIALKQFYGTILIDSRRLMCGLHKLLFAHYMYELYKCVLIYTARTINALHRAVLSIKSRLLVNPMNDWLTQHRAYKYVINVVRREICLKNILI